eukprot:4021560-Amphidinium_carterae.1
MDRADTAATLTSVDVGLATGEWCWMALPGCRQSAFRAELLAVVRVLEECQPRRVVSDCKGV